MTGSNGSFTGRGAALKRVEDPPLLRGARPYTDDLREPGALYAIFVRSAFAPATLNTIDTPAAEEMPGVVAVYTGADFDLKPFAPAGPPVTTPESMRRPVFATEKVRFIGEVVAVVIAETRALAGDASELVDVDYEWHDVLIAPASALEDGAPQL